MIKDVVMRQWLFDHQQTEFIKLFQVRQIIGTISGICITAQQNVWPALADLCECFQVPAGLNFYFDPLVTGCKLSLDLFQQLLMRVLNADGNSAIDLAASASQQLP